MNRFTKASGERVEGLVSDAQDRLSDSDQSPRTILLYRRNWMENITKVVGLQMGFPFAYPPHSNPSAIDNEKLSSLANLSREGA